MDRRTLIRRAVVTGGVVWTAPLVVESIASPAGAMTAEPPPGGVSLPTCHTVSSNTVVTFTVASGYQFVGSAALTSCATSVSLTPRSGPTLTLSFPKQTLHWVYLLVQTVPPGGCYLYVYNVTSPNPNGSLCNVQTLLSEAQCATPTVTGVCSPVRIGP